MGVFAWLFGRRAEEGETPGESQGAVPEPAAASPSTGPQRALEQLLPLLGAARVIPNPDDPDELEVRGAMRGRPARVKLGERPYLECELKAQVGARLLVLCRDPNKVPKQGDAADPWDDGHVRTFVAKGIFAEGDREMVDGVLRVLGGLTPATRDGLLAVMGEFSPASPIVVLVAGGQEVRLSGMVSYENAAEEANACLNALLPLAAEIEALPDPIQAMIEAAAGYVPATSGAATPATPAPQAPPEVVLCTYCSSRFVTAWGFNCPNCGAPHRG